MKKTVYKGTVVNPLGNKPSDTHDWSIHEKCFIGVDENGTISFVGVDESKLKENHPEYFDEDQATFVDYEHRFILPGMVDTHCHGPQYVNAGIGIDLPLLDWLNKYTFPVESKFSNIELAKKVYEKVTKATLRHGTTTCCYFATIHTEATKLFADIVKQLGQRAFIGKVCMDRNSPDTYIETTEDSIKGTNDVIDYIDGLNDSKIKAVVTPRFVPTCTSKLMHELGNIAKQRNVFIQSHLSENKAEIEWVKELHSDCKSYSDVYAKHGLLTENSIMAHVIHFSDEELKLIQTKKAAISHCPNSNFTICSGVSPVRQILEADVKIGLGTDISGGYHPSIFNAMRMAMVAAQTMHFENNSYKPLNYREIFWLATLGGAQALNLDDKIGSLVVGKQFDALVINAHVEHGAFDVFDDFDQTTKEIFQKVLLLCDDRHIERVFVQGKQVSGSIAV